MESSHQRKEDRADVSLDCVLRCEGDDIPCSLLDISANGAKVHTNKKLATGVKVSLLLEPFGRVLASTAWYREKSVGLRFVGDKNEIGEVLLGVATYAAV